MRTAPKSAQSGTRRDGRNGNDTGPRPETVEKYREALSLYTSTQRTAHEICSQCGVSTTGFMAYVRKYHREALFARYGVTCPAELIRQTKLHEARGQHAATHAKYKAAIEACDDNAYIQYNISQIARRFNLNPTGLANQLRVHYPEIIERRERERQRLGLNDNQQRGVRPWCKEQYARAIELLRTTDMTIPEAAEACKVSASGLSQHVLFYHKDLQHKRLLKRQQAKTHKKKGQISGNGQRHKPKTETQERYRKAVQLYAETAMTIREIAEGAGINPSTLYWYLRKWHKELSFARRGARYEEGKSLTDVKQYKRAAAAKYAPAIARLRESGQPVSRIAAEFGLHPETFRQYLREHEPQLWAQSGMMTTAEGKYVSRRSMEKYAEALHLYRTTTENRKAIAKRLGLVPNSFCGFVIRNFPEIIREHNELVERHRQEEEQQ